MERIDSAQLELFWQGKGQPAKPVSRALLDYLWSYEKVILLSICFIVTGVISFSFGVEKGKRAVKVPVQASLGQDSSSKVIIKPVMHEPLAVKKEETVKAQVPKAVLSTSGYTIQVASYQTRKYAQKEAEAIRKKGFSSFVLSKGAYSILCVGSFSNQEAAKIILSEMKKQYKDCVIRRL